MSTYRTDDSGWLEPEDDPEDVKKYGTSEGVRRAWDVRGRGVHEDPPRPGRTPRAEDLTTGHIKRELTDISGYSKNARDITTEQALAQANVSDIYTNMEADLGKIGSRYTRLEGISGNMNKENGRKIIKNAKAITRLYSGYMSGAPTNMLRDHLDRLDDILQSDEFSDVSAKDMNSFVIDNVQKLVYQEIESNRQQFTDHGIRHIVSDIDRQEQILSALGEDDPRTLLMATAIMVNHDVGYTTPLIREGDARGIQLSGQHPEMGAKVFEEQRDIWDRGRIFSEEEYDHMKEAIRTHDSPEIDRDDMLITSTRLADNLSIFSNEKLPSSFKYVHNGPEILKQMGDAAKDNDEKLFNTLRDNLWSEIDQDETINKDLARDLKSATRKMTMLTPKFTLGVLAGEVDDISYDQEEDRLEVAIRYNDFDSFLQRHFDMGQKQAKKLLEAYGETDFTKKEYNLGGFVRLRVIDTPKHRRVEKYSPDQPRVPAGEPSGGQFAGGASYSMSDLPESQQVAIRENLSKHGVTEADMRRRLSVALTVAGYTKYNGKSAAEHGLNWYDRVNAMAGKTAETIGVDKDHFIGAIAALSSNNVWERKSGSMPNLEIATRCAQIVKENPTVTITPEDVDAWKRGYGDQAELKTAQLIEQMIRDGESWRSIAIRTGVADSKARSMVKNGKVKEGREKWIGIKPEELDQWVGSRAINDLPASVAALRMASDSQLTKGVEGATTGWPNIAQAVRILRGENPDKVVLGNKVKAFMNTIRGQKNEPTVDRHMVRLMTGQLDIGLSIKEFPKIKIGAGKERIGATPRDWVKGIGSYPAFADAIRQATKDINSLKIFPEELTTDDTQAIAWYVQLSHYPTSRDRVRKDIESEIPWSDTYQVLRSAIGFVYGLSG